MAEPKAEVKSGFWNVTTFLGRAEIVFNHAISTTPTGLFRNQLTDLNIERMALIRDKEAIVAFAKKLRALLNLLVMNAIVLDEMSCDDTRFGEAEDQRVTIIKQLVEIMNE